jgi:hypothetical protein
MAEEFLLGLFAGLRLFSPRWNTMEEFLVGAFAGLRLFPPPLVHVLLASRTARKRLANVLVLAFVQWTLGIVHGSMLPLTLLRFTGRVLVDLVGPGPPSSTADAIATAAAADAIAASAAADAIAAAILGAGASLAYLLIFVFSTWWSAELVARVQAAAAVGSGSTLALSHGGGSAGASLPPPPSSPTLLAALVVLRALLLAALTLAALVLDHVPVLGRPLSVLLTAYTVGVAAFGGDAEEFAEERCLFATGFGLPVALLTFYGPGAGFVPAGGAFYVALAPFLGAAAAQVGADLGQPQPPPQQKQGWLGRRLRATLTRAAPPPSCGRRVRLLRPVRAAVALGLDGVRRGWTWCAGKGVGWGVGGLGQQKRP